jgi:hypothetical protein
MGTLKIGAGTTFNVTIPLDKAVSEYDNIFLSMYTDDKKPVRFSYVEKSGFNKLNIGNSASELVGVLTSAQTAKMRGCLLMAMKAVDEISPDENIGNSIPTNVKDTLGNNVEIVQSPLSETT